MKRGDRIDSATIAFIAVMFGDSLFHDKAVLSAAQVRTWPVSRLIEKVKEGRIYAVKQIPYHIAALIETYTKLTRIPYLIEHISKSELMKTIVDYGCFREEDRQGIVDSLMRELLEQGRI